MSKLTSMYRETVRPSGLLVTTDETRTHEGGVGFGKDPRTELFTLAVTNFVAEVMFYETGGDRDSRFVQLVRECALADPEWTAKMIGWLRDSANMRTASIVAAVEYAAVGAPNARQVIASACQRADEPADVLAYWRGKIGRKIPYAVQRGIADAAVRLYNQRSALKYDSAGSPWRMGDVIDICHPKPRNAEQSALFAWLLARRHNREGLTAEGLDGIRAVEIWRKSPGLDNWPTLLTWEAASSHMPTDARFWEAMIPQMGYMALLRNLRNFEQADISTEAMNAVEARLIEPDEVARSRQLPFRFWSAWKHSGTMRFGRALEMALDLSVGNVPEFPGRTLVMVDTSGSMQHPLSAKSKMTRVEAAALFGSIVAKRSADATVVLYATAAAEMDQMTSVLRTTGKIIRSVGAVGHGTNTWPATQLAWSDRGPFDRILVFTDSQDHPTRVTLSVPAKVPIFVWDLAGYKTTNIDVGSGRYLLGGLNDQSFKMVQALERGVAARWPWD